MQVGARGVSPMGVFPYRVPGGWCLRWQLRIGESMEDVTVFLRPIVIHGLKGRARKGDMRILRPYYEHGRREYCHLSPPESSQCQLYSSLGNGKIFICFRVTGRCNVPSIQYLCIKTSRTDIPFRQLPHTYLPTIFLTLYICMVEQSD